MSSNDSAVVVAVRVRPPSRRELSAGAKAVVAVDNNSLSVTDPTALMAMENLRGSSDSPLDQSVWSRRFTYDYCFNSIDPSLAGSDGYDDQVSACGERR
jgi:hypothetical protein